MVIENLITVIVPVYNVAPYLAQCLDSVLAQTYRNLEILVINDGSTDGSGQICEDYARKDSRIRLFHQSNQGLSAARNLGLDNMKGQYVTFIDSDDWVDETYIAHLWQAVVTEGAELVLAHYCCFVEETKTYLLTEQSGQAEVISAQTYLDRLFHSSDDAYVTAWGKLFHTRLFGGGERFPLGRLNEDQYLSYLLALKSQKTLVLNQTLYCYRQRLGSITNKGHSLKHIADDLQGHQQRLVDLALAGYPLDGALLFFKKRLETYRQSLEASGQVETGLYREIAKQLALAGGYYGTDGRFATD